MAQGTPSQLTISNPFTPRIADWAHRATTMMEVMPTGMGHQLKVESIRLENVSALTAIQLTADTASSRERMEELRAPRDFLASTDVDRPVL